MKTKTISTRSLVIMAMFAAVLCVSAYISIPLPNGSHITALNFIVTIIALIFPLEQSALILIIWTLLGLVGVPVFIGGNAGAGYLFGPLGGFSFAFILIAILVPLIRGQKYNRIIYTIVAIASAVLVDLVGSLWLMVAADMTLKAALLAGFAPFIVLDIVKAVIAAQIAPQFKKIFIGE